MTGESEPMPRVPSLRLRLLITVATLLAVLIGKPSAAQLERVPAELQAQILSKLAGYDRNFAARAGNAVRVLLVVKNDSPKSRLSAEEMKSALGRIDRIGGLPHEETIAPYQGADTLAARCRSERIAIVYVAPGFDDEINALRASLSGVDLLSVTPVPEYVPNGIVLGFELDEGKPKLVIHLEQARRQNVRFPADVLRLMKVYR